MWHEIQSTELDTDAGCIIRAEFSPARRVEMLSTNKDMNNWRYCPGSIGRLNAYVYGAGRGSQIL